MHLKHINGVENHIELKEEDLADIASSSLWTLSVKSQLGILLTTLLYVLFFILIWILFELGLGVFYQWALVSETRSLLIDSSSMNLGIWIGRIIFLILIFAIIFYKQIPLLRKIADQPKVNVT